VEDRPSADRRRRIVINRRLLFAAAPARYACSTDGDGHIGPGGRTGLHAVSYRTPGGPDPCVTVADRYCAAAYPNAYTNAYTNAYPQTHGHANTAAYTLSLPNPDTGGHRHAAAD
jgi:hypothetical protein